LPKRRDPGGMGDTPGKLKSTAFVSVGAFTSRASGADRRAGDHVFT